jgi:hypothetical protein
MYREDSKRSVNGSCPYADAQLFDLMHAHNMRCTHKLVLELDEHSHKVRVREYWSLFDASAGLNDAHLS